jgi:hypothetical protein
MNADNALRSGRLMILVALVALILAFVVLSPGAEPRRRRRDVDDYASRVGDEVAEPYRTSPSPAPETERKPNE